MRLTSKTLGIKRKGVILLVVLAMITLLTVLGITFVLYSDASEATARINMEGEKTAFQLNPADWSAGELMQTAFGQLVFDVEDDDAGQRSGLRGHSLSRDMYGYRYGGDPQASQSKLPDPPTTYQTQTHSLGLNDRPFRGTGRLSTSVSINGTDQPANYLINFSTFYSPNSGQLVPEIIRDPERLGARTNSTAPNAYVGGFNPPYTYADLNHVFLAKLGTDGQVDEPSFVRREAMGTTDRAIFQYPLGTLNGSNWDFSAQVWSDPAGKYRMVRPRTAEHPLFPAPSDGYGDVRNLPWGTHNDAVWIDLGVEPKTAPNGRKYKPLFAFTVLDLDGRANLNAHGNIHGRDQTGNPNQTHASRDGLGPWEVNLAQTASPAATTKMAPCLEPTCLKLYGKLHPITPTAHWMVTAAWMCPGRPPLTNSWDCQAHLWDLPPHLLAGSSPRFMAAWGRAKLRLSTKSLSSLWSISPATNCSTIAI